MRSQSCFNDCFADSQVKGHERLLALYKKCAAAEVPARLHPPQVGALRLNPQGRNIERKGKIGRRKLGADLNTPVRRRRNAPTLNLTLTHYLH